MDDNRYHNKYNSMQNVYSYHFCILFLKNKRQSQRRPPEIIINCCVDIIALEIHINVKFLIG